MRLTENHTTDELLYQRRQFLKFAACAAAGSTISLSTILAQQNRPTLTPLKTITHYNNYLEFSPNKEAVAVLAQILTTNPWTIKLYGEVEKTVELDIDKIGKLGEEERIYSLRCVEGWSMVIPWMGVPLRKIIELAQPLSSAKFIEFISLTRPKEMIGQRTNVLNWPYRESLRIDEAIHPLSLLVTGLYGHKLPNQNGAPVRLAIPWKYGFKSSKAIIGVRFLRSQPITTWMQAAPSEYGFYANVNPDVPHPRWSQRREVRIGESKKQDTLPFNGYANEVAHLYRDLDLNKYF